MKKLFQTLFSRRERAPLSRADNAVALNDVLARYREPQTRQSERPAAAATRAPASRPAASDPDRSSKLELDLDGLAIAEERVEGINPYDTGRFSTAELWEKRHRSRLT